MRGVRVAAAAAAALLSTGCGTGVEVLGVRIGAECPGVPKPLSTLAVAEDEANVHLYVTNQAFADPAVAMSVTIDGEVVLDQALDVCGQHNWVPFPLRLTPGWHDLSVTTDAGVTHTSRVDVPEGPGERWVVVSYWAEPDAHLDVLVRSEPVGFA